MSNIGNTFNDAARVLMEKKDQQMRDELSECVQIWDDSIKEREWDSNFLSESCRRYPRPDGDILECCIKHEKRMWFRPRDPRSCITKIAPANQQTFCSKLQARWAKHGISYVGLTYRRDGVILSTRVSKEKQHE
jgi:hypothetical protein